MLIELNDPLRAKELWGLYHLATPLGRVLAQRQNKGDGTWTNQEEPHCGPGYNSMSGPPTVNRPFRQQKTRTIREDHPSSLFLSFDKRTCYRLSSHSIRAICQAVNMRLP